jgi:hypothetical protein
VNTECCTRIRRRLALARRSHPPTIQRSGFYSAPEGHPGGWVESSFYPSIRASRRELSRARGQSGPDGQFVERLVWRHATLICLPVLKGTIAVNTACTCVESIDHAVNPRDDESRSLDLNENDSVRTVLFAFKQYWMLGWNRRFRMV